MLGVVAYSPKQFGFGVTRVIRSIPGIFREEARHFILSKTLAPRFLKTLAGSEEEPNLVLRNPRTDVLSLTVRPMLVKIVSLKKEN